MWKLGLSPRAIPRKGIHNGIFVAVRSPVAKSMHSKKCIGGGGASLTQHKFSFLRGPRLCMRCEDCIQSRALQASHQFISVGCSTPPPHFPAHPNMGPSPSGSQVPREVLIHKMGSRKKRGLYKAYNCCGGLLEKNRFC